MAIWEEALQILRNFEIEGGFPGIVACIDGTHIEITAPSVYKESYINRKGYYSMVLQIVCDYNKKIIDATCG